MEIVNLLNFLNNSTRLSSLSFASLEDDLLNLLNFSFEDEQFIQKVDLGIIYLEQQSSDQYIIVDGLNRFVSVSLLLHSICECYKKTSEKNEKAIRTIRTKYLTIGNDTKLKLPEAYQEVYYKIIFGEKLSGKEKESPVFKLLHKYWTMIKENGLRASDLLKILNKIYTTNVYTENVPNRDLYYNLNKSKNKINQLSLIENYLKDIGITSEFKTLKEVFDNSDRDLKLFFKDYYTTKFNFKGVSLEYLYEMFINYFETMLQYFPEDVLMSKIIKSAKLYKNILTVNFNNEKIKKAFIQIKMHSGDDTYAYLLNIYEDFIDNNITEYTLLEILDTVNEYLKNRLKTPNNVEFNELIHYLNAFISCK